MQGVKKFLIAFLALACLALTGCTADGKSVDDPTGTESVSDDSRTPVDPITDGGDFQGK